MDMAASSSGSSLFASSSSSSSSNEGSPRHDVGLISSFLHPARGLAFLSAPRAPLGHRGLMLQNRREMEEDCWSCLIIPITFWFVASMTLILGFYGSENLVLGPNTSRLLNANSLFVKEIEVQSGQHLGPMLYGFSFLPELNIRKSWSVRHEVNVQADYHQEWTMWLDKGSTVTVKYSIWSTGFFDILVAILRGRDGLHRWISDPTNIDFALSLHSVHGTGEFTFNTEEDYDYFFAIGNLNACDVKVQLEIVIDGMLYDTANADYKCSLSSRFCGVKLFIPGHKYALLTTPDVEQGKQDVWYVKLSYGQRWVTYFISLGALLSFTILVMRVASKFHYNARRLALPHQLPLLKENAINGGPYGTIGESGVSDRYIVQSGSSQPDDSAFEYNGIYDSHTCVVCCDAPRASFFDPCGHYVTCYPCGLRIQLEGGDSEENGESGVCPICRTKIQQIRKIYTA